MKAKLLRYGSKSPSSTIWNLVPSTRKNPSDSNPKPNPSPNQGTDPLQLAIWPSYGCFPGELCICHLREKSCSCLLRFSIRREWSGWASFLPLLKLWVSIDFDFAPELKPTIGHSGGYKEAQTGFLAQTLTQIMPRTPMKLITQDRKEGMIKSAPLPENSRTTSPPPGHISIGKHKFLSAQETCGDPREIGGENLADWTEEGDNCGGDDLNRTK